MSRDCGQVPIPILKRFGLIALVTTGLAHWGCAGHGDNVGRDAGGASMIGAASGGPLPGPGPDGPTDTGAHGTVMLVPRFVTTARAGCEFSSPIAISSRGETQVLVVTAEGTFTALDPTTGAEIWRVSLDAPAGQSPHLASPPALIPTNRLVFAWQDVTSDWTRMSHHVGVLDLEARALDPQFPTLTLAGSKATYDGARTIDFVPAHAYARSAVAYAHLPGHDLGLAYVSFGNVRDLQPWHGWLFEIDLDDWRATGSAGAVTASLITTDEDNCGPENVDGSRQMACGGGVWSHMGPQVVYDDGAPDGFRLVVATGNGALDPTRGDFANSVLRTGHGLAFEPGCDPLLCEPFDTMSPSQACMDSCENLFMPRLLAGQVVPDGANRVCVGRTFLGCYAALDWDLGANAPAVTALSGGPTVLVQPGKDGSVYLIDAHHLGTLYDRAELMAGCGEGGGTCAATWAGTIVAQPTIVNLTDGVVLALVPTFVEDDAHPAGLQALEISMAGGMPHLIPRWQAPSFATPESIREFRHHAGGVTVVDVAGEPFAAVVETAPPGQSGNLFWIRVRDGVIVEKLRLSGSGQRFSRPLALDGMLYVPSCEHTDTPDFNEGPSHLEAFSISQQ